MFSHSRSSILFHQSIPTLGQALTVGDPTGIDYVNSFLHVLAQNSDVAQQEYLEVKRKKKRKKKWSYDYPEIKKTSSREKEKRYKKRRASEPLVSERSSSFGSEVEAGLSIGDLYLDHSTTSIVQYGVANKNQQRQVVETDSGAYGGEESSSSPDSASFGEETLSPSTPALVALTPRFQDRSGSNSDKMDGMLTGVHSSSSEEPPLSIHRAYNGVYRHHSYPSVDSHYLSASSRLSFYSEFACDHNSSPETTVLDSGLNSAPHEDQFLGPDNTPIEGFLERGIDGPAKDSSTEHNENIEEQLHLDQHQLHDGVALQQEFNSLLEDLSCEQWWEEISCL